MIHLSSPWLASLVPLLPLAVQRSGDADAAVLEARAERPLVAGSPAPSARAGGVHPGNSLFHMNGADNAECVRGIPDVNGDGRAEIVVGIGVSGTFNLFCLDGSSSGAATLVWFRQTMDGVSGGSCYGDQSIVRVSDTESNGHANVLVGTAWGGRTAYDLDGATGAEVWKFDTYLEDESGWVYSLCEISDVTGDGTPEYAFGTGSFSDSVYLVNGKSLGPQADVLWRYPAGDAVYSVRNLGDVNADGTDDVLAAIGDNVDRIVCIEGDNEMAGGNVLWQYVPGVSVYACGVLTDVTGDGVNEAIAVLWTLGGSAIRCLDGTDGSLVWTSTAVPDYGMAVNELGDVTGDGMRDLIVSSWENAVIVLDGSDGSLVWKTTVGTTNGGDVWTARALGDVNGDLVPDVVAGSFDYHVYALDGADGAILWAFDTGNRVFSVSRVGDVNGDGRPDVAAGTQDTTSNRVVYVLEGDAGVSPPRKPRHVAVGLGPLLPPIVIQLP